VICRDFTVYTSFLSFTKFLSSVRQAGGGSHAIGEQLAGEIPSVVFPVPSL